jgi:hypothetical protein
MALVICCSQHLSSACVVPTSKLSLNSAEQDGMLVPGGPAKVQCRTHAAAQLQAGAQCGSLTCAEADMCGNQCPSMPAAELTATQCHVRLHGRMRTAVLGTPGAEWCTATSRVRLLSKAMRRLWAHALSSTAKAASMPNVAKLTVLGDRLTSYGL